VSEPIIAVGLGNPGFQYETTRHNVGFMVADALSAKLKGAWRPGRGEYLFSETTVQDTSLLLVKPLTYMNNSGIAVQDVLERYAVPISRLVVVLDDFWFDVGTVRVRAKGSDGGHNGLGSIIYHLNSEEFARIRCGIHSVAMPPKNEMAEFVLSPFNVDETEKVESMISSAADAVVSFALHGIEKTMNTFNV
jgi:peptidyl-tRNA hydrolase, PTH1 family